MSNFGELTHPIARKLHQCEWCYGPIPKGEPHCQYKGMWSNEWQNWRMHNECYEDYSYDPRDMADGFTPGHADMPERVKLIIANRIGGSISA